MRIRLVVGVVLVGALLSGGALRASDDEDSGKLGRRHDRKMHESHHAGPRATGMGGAYVALSNGANGIYENPASLGAQTDHQGMFELGFDRLKSDGRRANMTRIITGGAINLNAVSPQQFDRRRVGNQTAGIVYRHTGFSFSGSDDVGGSINGFTMAWGRSFYGGRMFGGLSLSYDGANFENDNETFDYDWNRVSFKAGGIYRVSKRLAVGSTLSLGFGGFTSNEGGYYLEDGSTRSYEWRGGFAYKINKKWLTAGDLSVRGLTQEDDKTDGYMHHQTVRLSNGFERVILPKVLTWRTGWYWDMHMFDGKSVLEDDERDGNLGWTTGLSFYHRDWTLSYNVDVGSGSVASHWLKAERSW